MRILIVAALLAACGTTSEAGPSEVAEPAAAPAPVEVPRVGAAEPAGAIEVKTPLGSPVQAEHYVAPPEDTVEGAIVASLGLLHAGDFDGWISGWCHPTLCNAPEAELSLREYNLPAAKDSAGACLQDEGKGVYVTKREAPNDQGEVRLYVWCGEGRMPAPSSLALHDGRWKVTSFSW